MAARWYLPLLELTKVDDRMLIIVDTRVVLPAISCRYALALFQWHRIFRG